MFRKLTTIIDSELVRKLEQDKLLIKSAGFRECMALAATMVASAGSDLSQAYFGKDIVRKERISLEDPDDAGTKLCYVIFESQRIEAVIKSFIPGFFIWKMFAYRTGQKTPFYRAEFQVSHEGNFSNGYGTGTYRLHK